MISVKLEGRLGNQLFQYAFAYTAAKKLGTGFYIDKSLGNFIVPRYFEVNNDFMYLVDKLFNLKTNRNIFTHRLRKLIYEQLKKTLNLKEVLISDTEEPRTEKEKICDQRIFKGYFQSEEYFSEELNHLKDLFKIRIPYRKEFQKILAEFPKEKQIITIHLRRGDYVDLKWAIPTSYFHQIISEVNSLYINALFVVISDDIEFAKKEFSYLRDAYYSKHSEIIDLQFLINADVCILSNSSFSWWGAFLNARNAVVYAPKYWCGLSEKKYYPQGINYGKSWIWK